MKYKFYPVLFVLCFALFMGVFGGLFGPMGINGPEVTSSECKDDLDHQTPIIYDTTSTIVLNGVNVSVKHFFFGRCVDGTYGTSGGSSCDQCTLDGHTEFTNHYTVKIEVYQLNSLIQTEMATVTEKINDGARNNIINYEADFVLPSIGTYTLKTIATEIDSSKSTSFTEVIGLAEGLSGAYNLVSFVVQCASSPNQVTFGSDDFTGDNSFTIDGANFTLGMNVSADFNAADVPCIENSYEFNESGNVSTNTTDKTITLSYTDDGNTVSQDFDYRFDNDNLILNLMDDDGNLFTMTFAPKGFLALR